MRTTVKSVFRRSLALLLCLGVVLPFAVGVQATELEDTGLCPHHQAHTEECGYVGECVCLANDAGETVHDENCALSPCTFQCLVCPIEEKINQLSPEQITQDTGTVAAQAALAEINAAVAALPEGLALTPDATQALDALKDQVQAVNTSIAEAVQADIAAIPGTIDAANKDSASALVAHITAAIGKVGREALTTAGVDLTSYNTAVEALKSLEETSQTPPEQEPTYYCGKEAHTHSAENNCFAEDGGLTCEKEEHTHTSLCLLTPEDREKVQAVDALIAALPTAAEYSAYLATKAGEDQAAYTSRIRDQLAKAQAAYEALGETLQAYVTDAARLTALGDQIQVQAVIDLIDALSTMDALNQTLAGYEEADDWDGYDAYLSEAIAQTRAAYAAFSALTEAQQQAVTNVDKLMALQLLWDGVTLDTPGALEGDGARVSQIKITDTATGTAPFDEDNNAGNDRSADNNIVRTFDTVTYNFEVTMESYDSALYSEARVKLEFLLPVTADQAVFDQSAMGWMDQTSAYAPELTTETRNINGVDTPCQVLTCYRYLLPSEGNTAVVPGKFGENLTVNVKSMKNDDTFEPIISAAMEYGNWNDTCPTHGQIEKATVTADKVTISAAPKYNVQIGGRASQKSSFDFNSGNDIAQKYGKGYGCGTVPGRVSVYGVTIQLYNDNRAKGFKGIELPEGEISFDIKTSSQYYINDPYDTGHTQGETVDTTEDYTPLLWSCDLNQREKTKSDGRTIVDPWGMSNGYAPFGRGSNGDLTCYQSGQWHATQEGDTIHVTISGYEIDVDEMPIKNDNNSTVLYGEDRGIGCFSAGQIWLVQPFNKLGSTSSNSGPDYDVFKAYGEGVFTTTVEVINMEANSISGAEFKDPEGTNYRQINQSDDRSSLTLRLALPGNLSNLVAYISATNNNAGVGVSNNRDGRDFAAIGTSLKLNGGLYYRHQYEESNLLYWGTNLTKFYGSAIELTGDEPYVSLSGGANAEKTMVYYATKEDGSDWESDYELQHTYEDDLVFYKSLSDIPEGALCVGILYCFQEDTYNEDIKQPCFQMLLSARVREDMDLAGETFMLASTSRVWTKEMFEEANMTLEEIPDWSKRDTKLDSFPPGALTSGNIDGSTFYRKETYASDGSGALGTHNSDWKVWGDTLLVIGYKAGITKTLSQKNTDNQSKTAYDLGAEQRVVDFTLQPSVNFDQIGADEGLTTTVTIVDTLPENLRYIAGSAYFGGTYTQTSNHGGTRGKITDGTLREPDNVTENDDGTTTLTWRIENVTVGTQMEPIYYSVYIGDRDNPDKDVPNGTTNFQNTVRISATHDIRQPSLANGNYAEVGFQASRGSASAFGKYSTQRLVEPDGTIDYVVYFDNNNLTDATVVLLDTMPFNGINDSNFNGTYTVTSWKLDVDRCTAGNLQVYYTMDDQYRDATTESLNRNGSAETTIKGWTPATMGNDGTITDMNGKKPVAWGIVGTLEATQSIRVSMQIKLAPDASTGSSAIENNYYVNTVSSDQTAIRAETGTVNRSLEGLAWEDENADGIQDGDETRMSGVKVELLKLKDGGNPATESDYGSFCYMGTETPVVIETGQQVSVRAGSASEATAYALGRYKFDDLPAGTYAVRFSDGTTTKISGMIASPANQGSNDAIDSDGFATYSDDHALQNAVIQDIVMPTAEEMSVLKYESKNHDLGLFKPVEFTFTKVHQAQGNKEPLSGAKFALFITNNEGSYDALLDTENLPTGWTQVGQTVTSGNDGKVSFTHLRPGTYRLVETEPPAGYVRPSGQWNVKLSPDEDPEIKCVGSNPPPGFFEESDALYLPNLQVVAFPESGGMGTFAYGFFGSLIMGGGLLLLLATKPRRTRRGE